MARRPVAVVTAVVLVAEAVGFVLLNWVLGLAVDEQQMSLGGLEPRTMTISAWAVGLLFGGYLLLCGALLLRTALLDRAPTGFGRVLLISNVVVHALIGALAVGLVGWVAFAALMGMLALQVWVLVGYADAPRPPADDDPDDTDATPRGGGSVTPTAS